jgi:hypothetical protein
LEVVEAYVALTPFYSPKVVPVNTSQTRQSLLA